MRLPDLIRQAVQARGISSRRRYRIRRVARPTYPVAQAVAYATTIDRPMRDLVQLVDRHVIANAGGLASAAAITRRHDEYGDTYGDTLEDIIRLVGQEFSNQWPPEELERLARTHAINLSETNRRQLTRILSNSLGVPVFFQDGWAAPEITTWVKTNAGLITSIKDQHLNDVRTLVTGAIRSGRTVQDVTKEIRRRYAQDLAGKPKNRAELIARDQVGKFYGNANQLRQRELGVERYVWRGVLDERERDSHVAKEGRIYRWDDPPTDTGHPGEDYQCRCTAEPYLADAIPTDIPSREDIVRDIARQQEELRRRERIESQSKVESVVKVQPLDEISTRIFASPKIYGGEASDHRLAANTLKIIAEKLGDASPAIAIPRIVFDHSRRYNGVVYRETRSGKLARLNISAVDREQRAFALAHEIGHVLDARDAIRAGLPRSWMSNVIGKKANPALLKVMEEIKKSPEIKWINGKRYANGRPIPLSRKYQQYLLSGSEMFARAFAQYVTVESGNRVMKLGLEHRKKLHIIQWSDEHFRPIREAMDEFIKGRK